ncbi:MAG: CopL family metal-binding regulatory protein [Vibrionaceae bacterium]
MRFNSLLLLIIMLFSVLGKTASAAWQMQSENCCSASQVTASHHAAAQHVAAQHHEEEQKKASEQHKKVDKDSANDCYENQDCMQNCNGASHGQKLAFLAHGVKKLAPQLDFVPSATPFHLYSIVLPTRYRPPIG